MTTQAHPAELLDRVQDLTAQVDELSDVRARTLAQELVATVIAMYGDGLARIIEVIGDSREAGATILDELSQDGAVASLLLIHDLYPVSLEERVIEALDTVRPYMESHGGNVELIGLEDGVAKLALQGSCNGCAASRATLELAIKQALDEHAPDLAGLEVQGVTEPAPSHGIALPMAAPAPPPRRRSSCPSCTRAARSRRWPAQPTPRWVPVAESARPATGSLAALRVDGVALLLAEVDGSLLAYGNDCAPAGSRWSEAELRRRDAALPGVRGRVRPAAGRPGRRRRAPAAQAGAAAGGGRPAGGDLSSSLRRDARPPASGPRWWRGCERWPRPAPPAARTGRHRRRQERCDLCNTTLPDDHRHMLHLVDRRIVCTCEACWALYSGNAEYRPTGMRTVWLDEFQCSRGDLGGLPDPDRAGVLHAQHGHRLAWWPSTPARPARPSPS